VTPASRGSGSTESGFPGDRDPRRRPPSRPAPRLTLETPVTYLKGVGPARAEMLARIGITVAGDLLQHVPHRYEDATTVTRIAQAHVGADVTVLGQVIAKGVLPTRKGLRVFQAVLQDSTGMLEVAWPGQPFLDRTINKGDWLLCTGAVRFFHGRRLQPREFVNLGPEEEGTSEGRVLAVYPSTEGLSVRWLRALVQQQLDALLPLVTEVLPSAVLKEADVVPLREALRMVHRPTSVAEAHLGRARLAFEELLYVQLLHRRANMLARTARHGTAFVNRRELTTRLRDALPFTLTGAQRRVIREIVADMGSAHRMHRLLQGDVGSGKTVVALFAALLAMENGKQVALMAPTELLAEQHARTAATLLAPLAISPVLITGRLSAKDRRAALSRLASHEPVLAVGTHALLQETVEFADLGLAIIDEQHRFGVAQRAKMWQKNHLPPHVLVMTATPIPRTLAMTLYGDLDVSVIDELPPGRKEIKTALRFDSQRLSVFQFLKEEIAKGRQIYIVYPLIEESETLDYKYLMDGYESIIRAFPRPQYQVGIVHGRMKSADKEAEMQLFANGKTHILVATTVIEVGVNVPNASVMLIENPEKFGLSQLHQLRGRVGRGADQSYCILLAGVKLTHEAKMRLQTMVETNDGFKIAEVDLKLRGPGNIMGTQQSGILNLKIADIVRDSALLKMARYAAMDILKEDPNLEATKNYPIRITYSDIDLKTGIWANIS